MDDLKEKSIVLATDLDGTFLGGSDAEKADLYRFIEDRRDDIGLVFVTGRDVDFIQKITRDEGVPAPDLIIGDVGTTIVDGRAYQPFAPVDEWIEAAWPGAEKAEEVLARAPHLKRQDVFGGRRVSFFYEDPIAAKATAAEIEALGYDVLLSADLFFDVLPRGVQKGPTLQKTVSALSIDPTKVLVAGDTLNDLSLFLTELDGVMVANAEAALVEAVKGLENVMHADREGAGGVHDAVIAKLNRPL